MTDQIILIDKPTGPTSNDVCQQIKRLLKIKKVGHAGTLDPLATGLLIVLTGQSTKRAQEFVGGTKEYEFTMRLGIETDTYDSQGKIVAEKPVPTDWKEKLEKIIPEFLGEITQITPPYSAVKHNGTPLYKLARQGKPVPVKLRRVVVEALGLFPLSPCGRGSGRGEVFASLKMRCSSGTYVRAIAHALGERLGCGAHITALRRISSEPFHVRDSVPLAKINFTPSNGV